MHIQYICMIFLKSCIIQIRTIKKMNKHIDFGVNHIKSVKYIKTLFLLYILIANNYLIK